MIFVQKKIILFGQKVTLKSFTNKNISNVYLSWLNDKNLMKFSNQRFLIHTKDSSKEYLKEIKKNGNIFLAIYSGNDFVGTITSYISQNHLTADIGILIGSQYTRKGYGLDAWNTLMYYLLSNGARKVTGGAMVTNIAMIKLMMNAGMEKDGIRLKHQFFDNQPVDIIHFAKFNRNF